MLFLNYGYVVYLVLELFDAMYLALDVSDVNLRGLITYSSFFLFF